jgi:putative PIN family toxin of toxin-antitoxin system
MNLAVIDTGVFVAGVFWRHEPNLCLKAWLLGIMTPVMSEEILAEYEAVLERVKREQHFTTDTALWVDTLRTSALWVTPVPFQEKVCRDPKDNKFIEAALAEQECDTIIARDQDLTVLEKPFGIEMLTPRVWLSTLTRPQRRRLRESGSKMTL